MDEFNTPVNSGGSPLPEIIANSIRIEGLLGRGGMGTVYRATHLSLDRVVAVKIINPEFAANAEITQRFTREARLMAKLRHPRAAMIYDSGTLPDGRLFIVMEYVEGITLADVLEKEGKLSYVKAVEIAANICDVLGEAHSLSIIHRDLKPANIMLNKQGVFVLDFGIAKMLNTDNAESMKLSMTGTGSLVGTPFYMSPEQCLGNPVEARSDLYSLGALLYEMIAGHPPFNDEVLSAVIIKHAMVEPPKLELSSENIPPALSDVVNRLLAKKPEDRPKDAAEAKLLLENSIAAQTSPMFKFLTQTNTAFDNSNSTKNFKQPTETLLPQPLAESQNLAQAHTLIQPSDSPVNKTGQTLKIIGGIAAALVLIAGLSIAGFLFFKPQSNNAAAANTGNYNVANANSMANMDHTNHKMPMDGGDFAKNAPTDDKTSSSGAIPIITEEEADQVITKITQTTEHRADGKQIIKTPKDSAIVCIHNMVEEGKTHMFAVERPNIKSQWEISARVSLDVPEFHGAKWTFEPQDLDGDGFEEVVFMGTNADHSAHRWLVYVPRTRQNYTVLVLYDANKKIITETFSPNALTPNGEAFRAALDKMVKEHH